MKKEKVQKEHVFLDLDEIACILEEEILSLQDRIRKGRIRDVQREEVRNKNLRTLGYLANVLKDLREKQKLERIEEKIEKLQRILKEEEDNKHDKIQKTRKKGR